MFITTLIRKKRLLLSSLTLKLIYMKKQRDAHREAVRQQLLRTENARKYLDTQLAHGNELSIQQVQFAFRHDDNLSAELIQKESALRVADHDIADLEKTLIHLQREIDKLADIAHKKSYLKIAAKQQREWLALDEWVINRRGAVA